MSSDQELLDVLNAHWDIFEKEKLTPLFEAISNDNQSSPEEVERIQTFIIRIVKSAFYSGFHEGSDEMHKRSTELFREIISSFSDASTDFMRALAEKASRL